MDEIRPIFDEHPLVIAGPCSAETEAQTLATARALARAGIRVFRAGVWKPRTRPGCFEGVGEQGLEWLAKVKAETGMAVATEVANKSHAEAALKADVDVLWIGARTSSNPFAVQEIADVLVANADKDVAVLVKNPISPDLELWLGALQRIYDAGVRRLAAVHRGFRTFGGSVYRNTPCWGVATALRLRCPKLPILCDPSHMGGSRELIAPIAQQAYDMGFDGLMVECHCCPDEAWSDASQQITPEMLKQILGQLVVKERESTSEALEGLRQRIDAADDDLLEVLARRMEISREIGEYKKQSGLAVVQADRYNDIIRSRVARGETLGIAPDFLTRVLMAIHDESVRTQIDILRESPAPQK